MVVSVGWYLSKHFQIGSIFNLVHVLATFWNLKIGVFGKFWWVLILRNTSQNISKLGACLTCKLHGLAIRDHSDFKNRIFFWWIFRVLILFKNQSASWSSEIGVFLATLNHKQSSYKANLFCRKHLIVQKTSTQYAWKKTCCCQTLKITCLK